MRQNISATRMELLNQKKKYALAKRGHKLLKDKEDELMRAIQEIVKKVFALRKEVEESLKKGMERYVLAKAGMDPMELEQAFLITKTEFSLSSSLKNVMSVKIPVYKKEFMGEMISYGFLNISPEVDLALMDLQKAFEKMIELAEMEKAITLLAEEMSRTRRRVNALEFILIPDIEEAIKTINMKLSEIERGNISRLMRIKDIIRK